MSEACIYISDRRRKRELTRCTQVGSRFQFSTDTNHATVTSQLRIPVSTLLVVFTPQVRWRFLVPLMAASFRVGRVARIESLSRNREDLSHDAPGILQGKSLSGLFTVYALVAKPTHSLSTSGQRRWFTENKLYDGLRCVTMEQPTK
jgi:hypothetical protein